MKASKFLSFFLFIIFQFELVSVVNDSIGQLESEIEQSIALKKNQVQEIDRRVIRVVEELGGGIYDRDVGAIIPLFPFQIRIEWMKYKNEIIERIGPIYPRESIQSNLWENNARTVDELLEDAWAASSYFREKCLQIAKKTDSEANFGFQDTSIVKSRASLARKVKKTAQKLRISEEEAVAKIRDALRGTIIVDTPEQIAVVVDAIKEFAQSEKREAVFINIWEENRASGYVSVHAKMLLPIPEKYVSGKKNIIIEIQIHLRCVMDGTMHGHFLYEYIRDDKRNSELQTSASTLLYLTALKQCPKSPLPRSIALLHFKRLN